MLQSLRSQAGGQACSFPESYQSQAGTKGTTKYEPAASEDKQQRSPIKQELEEKHLHSTLTSSPAAQAILFLQTAADGRSSFASLKEIYVCRELTAPGMPKDDQEAVPNGEPVLSGFAFKGDSGSFVALTMI